jgi:CheY-like chemotaxis protein
MMHDAQMPSPIGSANCREPRLPRPNWRRVYLLAAGISLLTVFISMGLALSTAGLFSDSAEASDVWAQRLTRHAQLNAMLIVVVVALGCGAGFQVILLSRRLAVVSEEHAELQRVKQLFEDASQARARFMAQLSHDIRTPLAGVAGMTALALETELTDEQRNYLGEVKASAETLLNVVVEHCDFPTVDSESRKLESIDFDLHQVVVSAVKTHSLSAREKSVELVCHVMPDVPPTLVGDPIRLQQVLTNLVGNAVISTDHGGVVLHVQLERQGSQEVSLRFAVQDASGGLAGEEQKLIAEALLETAIGNAIHAAGGASRRLLIAAQLVGQMGGSLRMVSVAGAGNTFHFTIDFAVSTRHCAEAAQGAIKPARQWELHSGDTTAIRTPEGFQSASPTAKTSSQQSGTGLHILLVEDDAINQRVASFMLKKRGHEVEVAPSGADALAALNRQTFDLVLMDVRMPGMDGFETTARIRQDERITGRHIPIVALTAQALPGDREKCLAAGMDGYVAKPIQTAELQATIEAVLAGAATAAEGAAWGLVAQPIWGVSRPIAGDRALPAVNVASIA